MAKPSVDYLAVLKTLRRHGADFIIVAAQEELHHRGQRGHSVAEPQWKIPDSKFKTLASGNLAGKATSYDLVSQRRDAGKERGSTNKQPQP
jgi:predicted deacetylase